MTGVVYKSTGSWYSVKAEDNTFYKCRMKGKFRIKGITSTNPIAVGDVVDFDIEKNTTEDTGVIDNIHERSNYVVRKSVNLSKRIHIIASNIDQVFLLITLNNPPTLTGFIDRFLATAAAYHLKTVLLFNKVDTYDSEEFLEVKYLADLYRKIGYTCLGVSALEGKNVDKVKEMMLGKTSMFIGHSGVGKSTLVNTIEPTLDIKTKQISEQHRQGQHTTTFAEMFDLSFDARIIDTPGIKGFGLVDMSPEEITDFFPEFFKLKQHCKFNNCLHIEEPKCAVKEALENDEIAASRYKSYLQIIAGDDEHYRVDDHRKE